jgi:hypothetical protein
LAELQKIKDDWTGRNCIVAAPGPSLAAVAKDVRLARCAYSWKVIAIQDAYRLLPYADLLYGCDNHWWDVYGDWDHPNKWSTHDDHKGTSNNKFANGMADKYGINCVRGEPGSTFSLDPAIVRYGQNSGFQAINIAILKGCKRIVLVGFDMSYRGGKAHFFGDHPEAFRQNSDGGFRGHVESFAVAAAALPKDISIVNATPGSALTCWPVMDFDKATSSLWNGGLHRDGSESHDATGGDGKKEGVCTSGV